MLSRERPIVGKRSERDVMSAEHKKNLNSFDENRRRESDDGVV